MQAQLAAFLFSKVTCNNCVLDFNIVKYVLACKAAETGDITPLVLAIPASFINSISEFMRAVHSNELVFVRDDDINHNAYVPLALVRDVLAIGRKTRIAHPFYIRIARTFQKINYPAWLVHAIKNLQVCDFMWFLLEQMHGG